MEIGLDELVRLQHRLFLQLTNALDASGALSRGTFADQLQSVADKSFGPEKAFFTMMASEVRMPGSLPLTIRVKA